VTRRASKRSFLEECLFRLPLVHLPEPAPRLLSKRFCSFSPPRFSEMPRLRNTWAKGFDDSTTQSLPQANTRQPIQVPDIGILGAHLWNDRVRCSCGAEFHTRSGTMLSPMDLEIMACQGEN
jgi:hypothetical protein